MDTVRDKSSETERSATAREYDDPARDATRPFLVDRQRIIQSAAFRRLQHKTQVFVVGGSDHYRTRMAHTLEVADLARGIALGLGIEDTLAETVALAHDLGHSPFGHAGERALDECMRESGGFEHNSHALRVVEFLEHPYPTFRGLNLTLVVRECLAKHTTQYDTPGPHDLQDGRPPPLEGQAAALADRLAYGLHDLQDGLYEGLVRPAAVAELKLWRRCAPGDERGDWHAHLRPTIDRIRVTLVDGAVKEARARSAAAGVGVLRQAGTRLPRVVELPDDLESDLRELDAFLLDNVYRTQRLIRMDTKAQRIVTRVFGAYVSEPRLMPRRYAERVSKQGVERVVADYIAGMTDRFCREEYARLFDARVDA